MDDTIIRHGVFRVDELKAHERNGYYFDDMDGEKWAEFLQSVREHGVINPPVITEDLRIISGHQRIRACRELGIDAVECCVKQFASREAEEIALIESNLRQRGVISSPSVKLGRILKTLEKIGGAEVDGHKSRFRVSAEKRKEIYGRLKITRKTACRARGLAGMPDKLQEMTIAGKLDATTAYEEIIKLPQETQQELARRLLEGDSYTKKEVKAILGALPDDDKIKALEERITEAHKLKDQTELELRQKLKETQGRERQTFEALEMEKKRHKRTVLSYEQKLERQEKYMMDYLQQTDADIIVGACQALVRALKTIEEREDAIERGDAHEAIEQALKALENVRKRVIISEGKIGA